VIKVEDLLNYYPATGAVSETPFGGKFKSPQTAIHIETIPDKPQAKTNLILFL